MQVLEQTFNSTVVRGPSTFTPDLLARFAEFADVKETTLKGYMSCLRQFAQWLAANEIAQPDRGHIKDYKTYLETRGFTAGTKAQYMRAVKHFFKWTSSENLYPNVAEGIKGAKVRQDNTKKEAFSESDVRVILGGISREDLAGKRDFAMILLAVTGGLRLIELHRANTDDVAVIRGQRVLYIQGKGRDEKDEYVKLTPEVDAALMDYMDAVRAQSIRDHLGQPLFTGTSNNGRGTRLSVPSLSRLVKTIFKSAGFDSTKLTAHSLRHTSNTVLFKAGADLFTVQRHARHTDPKTTQIYIHAAKRDDDQSEQEIYNRIFSPEKVDPVTRINELVRALSPEDQEQVLHAVLTLTYREEKQ